jgi:hypothetical protein
MPTDSREPKRHDAFEHSIPDRQHGAADVRWAHPYFGGTVVKDLQAAAAILLPSQRHTSRGNRELQLKIVQRVPRGYGHAAGLRRHFFWGKKRAKKRAKRARTFFLCALESGEMRNGSQDLRAEVAEPAPCRNLPSAMRWSAFGASS